MEPITMALFPKASDRPGWRRLVRPVFVLAAGLLLASVLAFGGASAASAADDVFTVANVPVDATAATAAAARERALQEGQRHAFQRLLQRLTPASQRARLPQLSDSAIADLVRDFEIAGEKTSPVRYIASLTVRFKPVEVRNALRDSGMAFSETPSKPVLVLPIVESSGGRVLSDSTDWYAAWARAVPGDGLVPFMLPGSADEVSALVPPDAAAAGDERTLMPLVARVGAGSVLVAVARPHADDATGRDGIDVSARRVGAAAGEETFVASFAPQPTDTVAAAVYDRAVAAVEAEIEETWKQSSVLRFDSMRSIAARVPLGELGSLVAVERGLDGLAPVQRVDIIRIGRDEAEFRLTFMGDEEQLRLLLAQRDLLLSGDGGGYVLRPASARPGSSR
ncbi:MAG: DUF2066 domain-containing protein [Gemmatimonas sp.]